MAHNSNPTKINRRLALYIGAGGLVGTLVSARTPIGPKEAALRERLRAMQADGLMDIRISWTVSAAAMTREEKCAAILGWLDSPVKPLNLGDRTIAA